MLTALLYLISFWLSIFIINDIDIVNYADDKIADNIHYLIKSLEKASTASFQWFDDNLLKTILTSVIYQ